MDSVGISTQKNHSAAKEVKINLKEELRSEHISEKSKSIFDDFNKISELKEGEGNIKLEEGRVVQLDDINLKKNMKEYLNKLDQLIEDNATSMEDLLLLRKAIDVKTGVIKGLQNLVKTIEGKWWTTDWNKEQKLTDIKEIIQKLEAVNIKIDNKIKEKTEYITNKNIEDLIDEFHLKSDNLNKNKEQLKALGFLEVEKFNDPCLNKLCDVLKGIKEEYISWDQKYSILALCIQNGRYRDKDIDDFKKNLDILDKLKGRTKETKKDDILSVVKDFVEIKDIEFNSKQFESFDIKEFDKFLDNVIKNIKDDKLTSEVGVKKSFLPMKKYISQSSDISAKDLTSIKEVIDNKLRELNDIKEQSKSKFLSIWDKQFQIQLANQAIKELNDAAVLIEKKLNKINTNLNKYGIEGLAINNKLSNRTIPEIMVQLDKWGFFDSNIIKTENIKGEESSLNKLYKCLSETNGLLPEQKNYIIANCIKNSDVYHEIEDFCTKVDKQNKNPYATPETKNDNLINCLLKLHVDLSAYQPQTKEKSQESIKADERVSELSIPDKEFKSDFTKKYETTMPLDYRVKFLNESLKNIANREEGQKLVFQANGIIRCAHRGLYGKMLVLSTEQYIDNLFIFANSLKDIVIKDISYSDIKELQGNIGKSIDELKKLKKLYKSEGKEKNIKIVDFAIAELTSFELGVKKHLKETIEPMKDFGEILTGIEKVSYLINPKNKEIKDDKQIIELIEKNLKKFGIVERKIFQGKANVELLNAIKTISECELDLNPEVNREKKYAILAQIIKRVLDCKGLESEYNKLYSELTNMVGYFEKLEQEKPIDFTADRKRELIYNYLTDTFTGLDARIKANEADKKMLDETIKSEQKYLIEFLLVPLRNIIKEVPGDFKELAQIIYNEISENPAFYAGAVVSGVGLPLVKTKLLGKISDWLANKLHDKGIIIDKKYFAELIAEIINGKIGKDEFIKKIIEKIGPENKEAQQELQKTLADLFGSVIEQAQGLYNTLLGLIPGATSNEDDSSEEQDPNGKDKEKVQG